MPIQTVEQAAISFSSNQTHTETMAAPYTCIREAFEAGAAWQKEEGIDWIRVEDALPIPHKNTCLIEVLVSNGKLWERRTYNDDAKIWGYGFKITHWSYVNLPKTDK